jgi:hypothetical protein
MVTEFGFPDKYDGRFNANVVRYADGHGFVGWDDYAFDGSTGGLFDLWKDAGPLFDPAQSGMPLVLGATSG